MGFRGSRYLSCLRKLARTLASVSRLSNLKSLPQDAVSHKINDYEKDMAANAQRDDNEKSYDD